MLPVCSLGLIWLAESTADCFFVRENTAGWLADLADNLKRIVGVIFGERKTMLADCWCAIWLGLSEPSFPRAD
jgi:hypothetical protein